MFAFVLSVLLGVQAVNVSPADQLKHGLSLALAGRYGESEDVMSKIDANKVSYDLYTFVRLMNNYALNKKADALRYGRMLDESFTSELPRRYKSMAYLMKNDLEAWGKSGELDDIARDMKHSANRLVNGQSGATTQKVQKDIVDKLDKLIKDQEDKMSGASAQSQPQGAEGNQKIGPGGQGQPAPDSIVMGGKGNGSVDEKQLKQIAEQWGTMPPAKRAKVVQDITRDLPPKFEPMIKNYFEALNKMHGYNHK